MRKPWDLREALLNQGRIDFLYVFQNEKKIFTAADHRFKQVALFVTKGGRTEGFRTRFRMGVGDSPEAHEIPDDLLRNDSAAMLFTPEDVRKNSPKSLSLIELRSPRDLAIFRKIYSHSIRIGDNSPGWEIAYAREFDMTNDSRLFPPLAQWETKGYKPDNFGRWVGPEGDVALPLYEGRMIGIFDASEKGWISGKGRTAVWRSIPFEFKKLEPQFLIAQDKFERWEKRVLGTKIGYMSIGSATNNRTGIACVVGEQPCGNSVSVLTINEGDLKDTLVAAGSISSLAYDYALRARVGGINLNWFILEESVIPQPSQDEKSYQLGLNTARLTFIHRRFAPEWLKLKHLHPELASKEWKHWWSVTEADRLRLRFEIDALCADLYGLDPDDFDWIVRDDPTDPKGFYRVDRQLPFRERLTGLAAAAFRALKEGKWSAETAASLSNDEFFDLLGIPELTNARAAHAKGLPGPLIEKRDGCHVWKPEDFSKNDPRHGWTWDDCWNDAVALLGSEEAVRRYVAEEPKTAEPSHDEEPFRLQAKTPTPSQGKLF